MSLAGLPKAWPVAPTPEFVWTKQREGGLQGPWVQGRRWRCCLPQYWGDSSNSGAFVPAALCVCSRRNSPHSSSAANYSSACSAPPQPLKWVLLPPYRPHTLIAAPSRPCCWLLSFFLVFSAGCWGKLQCSSKQKENLCFYRV